MKSDGLSIRVRGLSKVYSITEGALRRPSFGEVVMNRLRNPLRRPQKNTFWALKDVSFDVAEGDVVGVIGRNGAGKSTLLKILSRITDPSAGRIELYGNVGSLLEVGTGFHPELTGRENIFLNGSILGMSRPEIRRQFDAIVDFAEVQQFIDTPVKRYSSGMYVRLAFAVAAHLRSDILIVDEVLAVGDMEFQKKCLGKMKDVSVGGRTVLFVSHNLRTVTELCRSALLLSGGRIVTAGSASACIAEYISSTRLDLVAHYKAADRNGLSGQQVTLEEATLHNADGEVIHSLRFGEPFSVKMRWNNRAGIKSLCYVVRISDAQDTLVCAINSIGRIEPGTDGRDASTATCAFVWNALVPGRYRMELTAWQRPGGLLGGVPACLVMEVDATAYDPEFRFNVTGNPMLSMKTNWSADKLEASQPLAAEWGMSRG